MADDRYTPNPLDGPASDAEWRRGIEQRLAEVEARGAYAATLTSIDTDGNELVRIGKLLDGSFGILITDAEGRALFRVDSVSGQTAPFVHPVPVVATTALLSGTTSGFRPGTNSASFVSLWAHEFWSVGDQVDYDLTFYANAGSMDWRITVHEVGAPAVVAVGPNTETTNVQRAGTLTIPATALVSGTDVAGRRMRLDVEVKKNSGTSTVDASLNAPPRNYGA